MHFDSITEQLNHECFCITLDRDELCRALEAEIGDDSFCETFIRPRQHLFSNVPIFLKSSDVAEMLRIVTAIETVARLGEYRKAVMSWAPEIAFQDFGPRGAFMGYDFHLADKGPKLIEINSNAGGAFLNALLLRAQRACCPEIAAAVSKQQDNDFDAAVHQMFETEWLLQGRKGQLRCIAIVDENPRDQYLYPEFLLARKLLVRHGIEAIVADPSELAYLDGSLVFGGQPIDLVYNRLVDFSLERPEHRALREAYNAGAVVVSPNPHIHALFADKRNLTILSDQELLRGWGVSTETLDALAGIPKTQAVSAGNATSLWENRKHLYFKPFSGYGGKAVYRGDKRLFAESCG